MGTAEATLTDFLRDPNAVVERLEHGDVVLHRRNAADLRLSLESRGDSITESVGVLAGILSIALTDGRVRSRMRTGAAAIPWLAFLPETERELFLAEFLRVAKASAELGVLTPMAQLLREWRATAAIHAEPGLAAELRRPLAGNGRRVPAPEAQ